MTKAKVKPLYAKILALLLAFCIVVFALPLAACDKGGTGAGGNINEDYGDIPDGHVRVILNYYRLKEDYDDWNVWFWAVGSEGSEYTFKTQTYEMAGVKWKRCVADIPNVDTSLDEPIGFIVRKGEWAKKDPDMDRFVTSAMISNNQATIYVAQDRVGIYNDAQTAYDAATSNTIDGASFTSFKKLRIDTSTKITTASYFKVYDDSNNVVASLDCSTETKYNNSKAAIITFSEDVDITKAYRIVDEPATEFNKEVNFVGCDINMSSLYTQKEFTKNYIYDGDLGVEYSAEQSIFRVWSPVASEMKLNIYSAGEGGNASVTSMTKGEKGVWTATIGGDQNGKYYTYTVTARGSTKEVVDPYARSAGRDGKRGMILDLDSTDPTGWSEQANPTLDSYSEAVIYEAQLRDLTINPNSGVSDANRGKFLGLTETGTTVTVDGVTKSTGLDYLAELGVTTVHFQPLFDFASVSEDFNVATYNKDGEYNWGYDPLNYNVPEGSYSSNPADGSVRVNEMKQMVMALHNKGIQVVMDVVYNHVSSAQGSNFEALVPGYYFRTQADGTYYNGSGCGNVTASERAMFRKFMIDSVVYWTEEYGIDGFRFDLMGCHDITTMNEIYDTVSAINPDVMIYGEGWTGGTTGLADNESALQKNADKCPNIAFFNDTIRDGLKGSVFDMKDTGFVSGKGGTDSIVYGGALGATGGFAASPIQTINYVSAHDNSTLWDKLNASVDESEDVLKAMNRLAATSVITSQGAAFFLAGEEMLRSKPTEAENSYDNRPNAWITDDTYYFSDNSYKSSDSVNAIDWTNRVKNNDMIEYYKALISLKRNNPAFQYATKADITANVVTSVDDKLSDGVAVYAIKTENSVVILAFNSTDAAVTVDIPQGDYKVYVNGTTVNTSGTAMSGDSVEVGAYSAVIIEANGISLDGWTYSVA